MQFLHLHVWHWSTHQPSALRTFDFAQWHEVKLVIDTREDFCNGLSWKSSSQRLGDLPWYNGGLWNSPQNMGIRFNYTICNSDGWYQYSHNGSSNQECEVFTVFTHQKLGADPHDKNAEIPSCNEHLVDFDILFTGHEIFAFVFNDARKDWLGCRTWSPYTKATNGEAKNRA